MKLQAEIAAHFRQVYYGKNWTAVNLKDSLAGINWEQATTKIYTFNTIAALVFHINYYVSTALEVLRGGPLNAHDSESFLLPPIQSEEDWQKLVSKMFSDAESFAGEIEKMPEDRLSEIFPGENYGNYYYNLSGIIEHNHYHLGQIVLIKKALHEIK
jgi:uncharacterized damage-inducible protein DinB